MVAPKCSKPLRKLLERKGLATRAGLTAAFLPPAGSSGLSSESRVCSLSSLLERRLLFPTIFPHPQTAPCAFPNFHLHVTCHLAESVSLRVVRALTSTERSLRACGHSCPPPPHLLTHHTSHASCQAPPSEPTAEAAPLLHLHKPHASPLRVPIKGHLLPPP